MRHGDLQVDACTEEFLGGPLLAHGLGGAPDDLMASSSSSISSLSSSSSSALEHALFLGGVGSAAGTVGNVWRFCVVFFSFVFAFYDTYRATFHCTFRGTLHATLHDMLSPAYSYAKPRPAWNYGSAALTYRLQPQPRRSPSHGMCASYGQS